MRNYRAQRSAIIESAAALETPQAIAESRIRRIAMARTKPTISPLDEATIVQFDDVELHIARRELRVAGAVVPLQRKAFALLVFLIAQRDRVVAKDELLTVIWHTTSISESVVARVVMKVRRSLGDVGEEPRYLRTVHRVGYRFTGNVHLRIDPSVKQRAEVGIDDDASTLRVGVMPISN